MKTKDIIHDPTYFATRLSKALDAAGVKPYTVGMEVGLDPSLVWCIAHGRRIPTKQVINRLANSKLLNIPHEVLSAWLIRCHFAPDAVDAAAKLVG